jgi:hypothetical protein
MRRNSGPETTITAIVHIRPNARKAVQPARRGSFDFSQASPATIIGFRGLALEAAAFLEGDFDCESKAGALQVGWPTDYAVTSFTAVTLSAKDCRTGDTKVIGVQAIRLIVEEAWELRWAQVFFAQSLVLTEEHPGRPGLGGVLVNRVAVVVSKAAWQTNSKTRAWRSFGLWWNPSLVW